MIDTTFKYFVILARYSEAEPMPAAIKRNGTASPKENTPKRNAPCPTVVEVAASVKMAPNTGPTHGVHPKAKAEPKITELKGFPGLMNLAAWICFSPPKKIKERKAEYACHVKSENYYKYSANP